MFQAATASCSLFKIPATSAFIKGVTFFSILSMSYLKIFLPLPLPMSIIS